MNSELCSNRIFFCLDTASNEDFIVATRRIIYPASLDGTTRCTSFDIVDDDIALEGTETFRVVYNIVSPPGAMRGPIEVAWVDITENDGEKIIAHAHTHVHEPSLIIFMSWVWF